MSRENGDVSERRGMSADGEEPELNIIESPEPTAATFVFHHEDHTIGNTLRYILNKTPEVAFVGYSVPHPSEPKMNLRLQTVGPSATTVLHEALGNVYEVGAHVLTTFDAAIDDFRQKEQR